MDKENIEKEKAFLHTSLQNLQNEKEKLENGWKELRIVQADMAKEQLRREDLSLKSEKEVGIEANIKIDRLCKVIENLNGQMGNIKSYSEEMENLTNTFF